MVRSLMSARSSSATNPTIRRTIRPAGVEVSTDWSSTTRLARDLDAVDHVEQVTQARASRSSSVDDDLVAGP